ncbi:MAG: D-glycero-beta-D-manno-heptose 1,7-bisphosphate 7-phosphatase [Burkholderiales bacterium]|nr:D-glycero-beta-D-manno-heptose 1,7-bisphosphate 7-phosphatase [Burkholderiales bacterium]
MKLIILDRDGVINHDSAQFVKTPDEWRPIPGALEAIARLTQAGYRVVIATNQSGIGRGLFDMAALNAINNKMVKAVTQAGGRIEAIFYCPDTAESSSRFRKPAPGMLVEIGERFNTSLENVPAVGDSLRDLQAADAVGAEPILVLSGKGAATRQAGGLPQRTRVFDDLAAVAQELVR